MKDSLTLSFLLLFLFLGILFRLEKLSQNPLWHDEIIAEHRAHGGSKAHLKAFELRQSSPLQKYHHSEGDSTFTTLATIFAPSGERRYMPMYYALSRVMMAFTFGDVRALKTTSFLCSILLLLSVYALTRAIFKSSSIGLLALLSAALNPVLIQYSVEARPYMMLSLCSCELIRTVTKLYTEKLSARVSAYYLGYFFIIILIGSHTHLLFIAFLVSSLAYLAIFKISKLTINVAMLSLLALSIACIRIVPILQSADTHHHFSSRLLSSEFVYTKAAQAWSVLYFAPTAVSILLPLVFLCIAISYSAKKRRFVPVFFVVTVLCTPSLAFLIFDLSLFGIKSTVLRYNLGLTLLPGLLVSSVAYLFMRRYNNHSISTFVCGSLYLLFLSHSIHVDEVVASMKGGRFRSLETVKQLTEKSALLVTNLKGEKAQEVLYNTPAGIPIYSTSMISFREIQRRVVEVHTMSIGESVLGIFEVETSPPEETLPHGFRWNLIYEDGNISICTVAKNES